MTSIRSQQYEINYLALQDYLAFQTVIAPDTIYRGVHQLEPAHLITYRIETEESHIESYWDIPRKEKNLSIDDAVFQLDEILSKTVKSQMVSDVPIGAFLSGGIDSSLITHYMAKNNSSKFKTYNVAFEQGTFDETPYALEVSEKCDTEYLVIEGPSMTASDLVDAISSLDQPLGDPAYPLTWFLSKTTKQYITVALSGDGGDELFGG